MKTENMEKLIEKWVEEGVGVKVVVDRLNSRGISLSKTPDIKSIYVRKYNLKYKRNQRKNEAFRKKEVELQLIRDKAPKSVKRRRLYMEEYNKRPEVIARKRECIKKSPSPVA